LELWYLLRYNLNPGNRNYRLFLLTHNVVEYIQVSRFDSEFGYKCGKCREVLFYSNDLVPHDDNWWKMLSEPCSLGLVVLPLVWMKSSENEPRLNCFKCRNKLGCVGLRSPISCPCSARIYPGFFVNPSRVDKYKLNQAL